MAKVNVVEEVQKLVSEVYKNEQNTTRLIAENNKLRQDMASLRADFDPMKARAVEYMKDLDRYKLDIQRITKERDEVRTALSDTTSKFKESEKLVYGLRNDIAELKTITHRREAATATH